MLEEQGSDCLYGLLGNQALLCPALFLALSILAECLTIPKIAVPVAGPLVSSLECPHKGCSGLRLTVPGYALGFIVIGKPRILHILDSTYDEEMRLPLSKKGQWEKPDTSIHILQNEVVPITSNSTAKQTQIETHFL